MPPRQVQLCQSAAVKSTATSKSDADMFKMQCFGHIVVVGRRPEQALVAGDVNPQAIPGAGKVLKSVAVVGCMATGTPSNEAARP